MNIPTLTRAQQFVVGGLVAITLLWCLFGCAASPTTTERVTPSALLTGPTISYRVTCATPAPYHDCTIYGDASGEGSRHKGVTSAVLTGPYMGGDMLFSFVAFWNTTTGGHGNPSQKIKWLYKANGTTQMLVPEGPILPRQPVPSQFTITKLP